MFIIIYCIHCYLRKLNINIIAWIFIFHNFEFFSYKSQKKTPVTSKEISYSHYNVLSVIHIDDNILDL